MRGACFGECPQYSLVVSADGRVRYHGDQDVRVKGSRRRSVPAAALDATLEAFRQASFFDLEDRYERGFGGWSAPSDAPWSCVSFEQQGRTKSVARYGRAGPALLEALERTLEDLANVDEFALRGDELEESRALRRSRAEARRRLGWLLEHLATEPPASRFAAVQEALELGGEHGLLAARELAALAPFVAQALREPDPSVRESAAATLEYFWGTELLGTDAAARLRDPASAVRHQAARALYRMGNRMPPEALPLLRELAQKGSDADRRAAAQALVPVDMPAAQSALWSLLASPSEAARFAAIGVLDELDAGVLRSAGPSLVPALRARLADVSWKVRGHAAWVLGSLGSEARAAAAELESMGTQDPHPIVQMNAERAFRQVMAAPPAQDDPCGDLLRQVPRR